MLIPRLDRSRPSMRTTAGSLLNKLEYQMQMLNDKNTIETRLFEKTELYGPAPYTHVLFRLVERIQPKSAQLVLTVISGCRSISERFSCSISTCVAAMNDSERAGSSKRMRWDRTGFRQGVLQTKERDQDGAGVVWVVGLMLKSVSKPPSEQTTRPRQQRCCATRM